MCTLDHVTSKLMSSPEMLTRSSWCQVWISCHEWPHDLLPVCRSHDSALPLSRRPLHCIVAGVAFSLISTRLFRQPLSMLRFISSAALIFLVSICVPRTCCIMRPSATLIPQNSVQDLVHPGIPSPPARECRSSSTRLCAEHV